jgi:large subunit ribosomal protein L19
MNSTVSLVQEKLITKNDFPSFSSGDTLTVYYEIREGDKVRTQSFKGVVIQIKGRGESKTFTIRKMSGTVGVERIFPLNMPALNKIEVNKKARIKEV